MKCVLWFPCCEIKARFCDLSIRPIKRYVTSIKPEWLWDQLLFSRRKLEAWLKGTVQNLEKHQKIRTAAPTILIKGIHILMLNTRHAFHSLYQDISILPDELEAASTIKTTKHIEKFSTDYNKINHFLENNWTKY